jgi:hypothetical protein
MGYTYDLLSGTRPENHECVVTSPSNDTIFIVDSARGESPSIACWREDGPGYVSWTEEWTSDGQTARLRTRIQPDDRSPPGLITRCGADHIRAAYLDEYDPLVAYCGARVDVAPVDIGVHNVIRTDDVGSYDVTVTLSTQPSAWTRIVRFMERMAGKDKGFI